MRTPLGGSWLRMQGTRQLLARRPRVVAALFFGISTGVLTHFAWYSTARLSGMVPGLTLAAGLAHAIGGSLTGPRIMDPTRTRTPLHAALLGAATSLLALILFAPAMAAYVSAGSASAPTPLGYLVLTVFTALFAFLGAGWALLLISAAVGVGLHWLATPSAAA